VSDERFTVMLSADELRTVVAALVKWDEQPLRERLERRLRRIERKAAS
jgi:hypothetical protein